MPVAGRLVGFGADLESISGPGQFLVRLGPAGSGSSTTAAAQILQRLGFLGGFAAAAGMWFGTGAPTTAAVTADLHGLWFSTAGFGMSFKGVVGGILGLGGFLAVGLAGGTAVTAADGLGGRSFFDFVEGRQMLGQCCGPSTGR